jgi:hypothetical protein
MIVSWKHLPVLCASLLLLGGASIKATTIDLSSALPAGNLPDSETVGGFTMTGWTVSKANNTIWSNLNVILNNRLDLPNDSGIGVCSPLTPPSCPTSGSGNINEIDNNGTTFEVLRFDFNTPTIVNSFGLSSLDSGLKDGFAIFGSNTAQPTISGLTALASGTNTSIGSINPTIAINQSFRYFFVTSLNRGTTSSGSDFLVKTVSYTPEPITLSLVGLGLLGMGAQRRKGSRGE